MSLASPLHTVVSFYGSEWPTLPTPLSTLREKEELVFCNYNPLLLYQILSFLFWNISSTLFLHFNVVCKVKVREKVEIILLVLQGETGDFLLLSMIYILKPKLFFSGNIEDLFDK